MPSHERKPIWRRRWYEKKRASGRCVGCPGPRTSALLLCDECRRKNAKNYRRLALARLRAGICMRCRAEPRKSDCTIGVRCSDALKAKYRAERG